MALYFHYLYLIYMVYYIIKTTQRDFIEFFYLSAIAALCPMLSWVIIPFIYLQGNASINDDVTKFLVVFCEYYNPLIVSLVASFLI